MNKSKITQILWFHTEDGKIESVLNYYSTIFGDNFKSESVVPLGDTPSGYSEMVNLSLFGVAYSFMSSAIEHHALNDAFSIMIFCNGQEEIDLYWDYFTKEGEESQCSWCIDKFGLRWQIIPENFGELLSTPGGWDVMMNQKKIVIGDYLK